MAAAAPENVRHEICFFVFDAASTREAAVVAQQAGLDPLRVVEALPSRTEHE